MKITKANIKKLRNEMNKELEALASKYGVSIDVGNARYSDNSVTFKVEVANESANGLVLNKKAQSLLDHVKIKNWPFTLGTVIVLTGREFKIIGFNTRASKYPIEIQSLDDNLEYKCSVQQASNAPQLNG